MEWTDDAVVIGVRLHGETGVIAELLTRERGRHTGFVHGGRSRRLRPILQPGNSVRASWHSRIDEALGSLTLEGLDLRAARIMGSARSLHGVNLLCTLARLLPERERQDELYAMLIAILDDGDHDLASAAMVQFELLLLRELGFGLDLERCAATGTDRDLAYVSPKTGRAVSRSAGEPYRDRIFALPAFLLSDETTPSRADVAAGFALTEFFLNRHVFAPRGQPMPACRAAYLAAIFGSEPLRSVGTG